MACGVLTSGGDSPAMNAAIRAAIRTAHHYGLKTYVIRDGYSGLINDNIDEFGWEQCGQILPLGGTMIGTARSEQFKTEQGRRIACRNLISRGIDSLVVIGGDGSLMGACTLAKEWSSHLHALVKDGHLSQDQIKGREKLHFVGLSGSIDNDMYGTDNTIGADTALHRICEAIDYIATTASSHKRAFVMEVMGRNCGYLALISALVTGADWLFIPEDPPQEGWENAMCETIRNGRKNGKTCSIVVLSEGARDASGESIKSEYVKNVLEDNMNLDTRVTVLGHIQRGGSPSAYDRYLATITGVQAVKTLMDPLIKEPQLIGMTGLRWTSVPILPSVEENMKMSQSTKEGNFDYVMSKKHHSFQENLNLFNVLKESAPPKKKDSKLRFTVAITSVGAPAPGMNNFFRAVTRLAIHQGHRAVIVKGGFKGLVEGNVEEFDWMSVNGYAPVGGCILGTNRDLPSTVGVSKVAQALKKHKIDAFIIVGGFEAYHGIIQLNELGRYKEGDRQKERTLRKFGMSTDEIHCQQTRNTLRNVSFVVAPATISNNLPATESSIGIDKAMNNMVDATDKIKQSSIGYCNRIFLVQVMGGYCGFQALMGSIISGAEGYFLHEDNIRLRHITKYIEDFGYRFDTSEPKLSLFVLNEKASSDYSLHVVQKIFDAETDPSISARTSELGSIQQGGNPTPFDRIVAGRYAMAATAFVEKQLKSSDGERDSCVVGLWGGEIHYTSIAELIPEMDLEHRRPMHQWWVDLKGVSDLLSHSKLDDDTVKQCLESVEKFIVQERQEEQLPLE